MLDKEINLYKRHKVIYTDPVPGKFDKIRTLSMSVVALSFFLIPWLSYHGRQAVMFDILTIRFYFFKYVFWPQDFILFAIFVMMCILGLFTITVFVGRVWCGFLCPQSVWVRFAAFLTRMVEGKMNKRIKNDLKDFTFNHFMKKVVKHCLIFLFSLATGFTLVSYFISVTFLITSIFSFNILQWSFFWIVFITILTHLNVHWFKEQFCFIICPYARLQSVMFDKNTLIIAYNSDRGEKRGSRKKNAVLTNSDLGDCIDCNACVNCCPTGIDIRHGLQIECITCAACIDACNSVMKKMGYKKNLIGYIKESDLNVNYNPGVNIRFYAYFIASVILLLIFSYLLINRNLIQLHINRSQLKLYNVTVDNFIENSYILKITNKTNDNMQYNISICEDNFNYIGLSKIALNKEDTILLDVMISIHKTFTTSCFHSITFKIENINNTKDFLTKTVKFILPN